MRTNIAIVALLTLPTLLAMSACGTGHGLLTRTYANAPPDPSIATLKQVGAMKSVGNGSGGSIAGTPVCSGVYVGPHHVLTAYHCVLGPYPLTGVRGRQAANLDGDHASGAEVWGDKALDLSLIRVDKAAGTPRELRCSDAPFDGPMLIRNGLREIRTEVVPPHQVPWDMSLRTVALRAAVGRGDSGSPVLDEQGRVVGIVIESLRQGRTAQVDTAIAARVTLACADIKAAMGKR